MPRRSGRYPYGSRDRPYQREKYDPPYSRKDIEKVYGKEIANRLYKDPSHKFRMDTGIELIHQEPSFEELQRIYRNWKMMSNEQKKLSDQKSKELFGMTNEEHYKYLMKTVYGDMDIKIKESRKALEKYEKVKHSQEEGVKIKMNNIYYLSHGGPGSGRYPLGSGDRPYQKFEGSRKKNRGILGYIKSVKNKKENEKVQKQKIKEEEKQREFEANKESVLRSGSALEVEKYKGKISNAELQQATDRLRLEQQLDRFSEAEKNKGLEILKKIQSYTNVGSSLARDGIDLWNSFATIYNTTSNGKENPLPFVSKDKGKDKGKDKE